MFQCGNTVEAQFALFNNIKPLFSNKPLIVVVNKIDVKKIEDLPEERKALFEDLKKVSQKLGSFTSSRVCSVWLVFVTDNVNVTAV